MSEIKWTKEKVFEESKKYKYASRAYVVTHNNGWMDERNRMACYKEGY